MSFDLYRYIVGGIFCLVMGALDEGHFNQELENGVKLDCLEVGFQQQTETLAIENAVTVLLHGLGEDVNREGLKKTPLRVAKALLHGTKGTIYLCFLLKRFFFQDLGISFSIKIIDF